VSRALIYTRVSEDRAGGRSPAEQEAEARAICGREGWQIVEVVTDSVGASRHSKGKRPGWARTRQLIASGEVDVLVCWESSRAQRDLGAYAELRDLCVAHGVRWSYKGRTHDLANGDDRFRTGLDALLAEREADEISERVQRAMRANASRGRPHGRRLYGFQRVYDETTGALTGQVPHADEAPVVERVFREYLAGKGIRTIAAGLNADRITTGTGVAWRDSQVRRLLSNPAYVARRVHRGQIVGLADWPALVSAETFDRVQARLEGRRGIRQGRTPRLLTGVGRCGVCGGKLSVGKAGERRFYQCRSAGFCVARDLINLDGYVTLVVLERLGRPDVAEAFREAPNPAVETARGRAVELRSRLDDAVREFTAGRLSAATLAKIETDLTSRIADVERTARAALVPLELDLPAPDRVGAWWGQLSGEQRREVVAALLAAVVVNPVGIGRRTFDPSAIRIDWH
jgi:DNA invertase Pin-like site-specific DNA recombinase